MTHRSILQQIEMDISYLSTLDYIDLINLCKISGYRDICNNNTLLKKILINKNIDIILAKNLDIIKALNDIYMQFGKIFYSIYDLNNIPNWIDKEKFINHMINTIRSNFVPQLIERIIDTKEENGELQSGMEIYLYKDIIVIPYIVGDANNLRMEIDDLLNNSDIIILNTITLPESFIEYIQPTLINIYNKYDDNTYYNHLIQAINNLLFIE